jgi:drug/metabolite transporter (DMT)-like permease
VIGQLLFKNSALTANEVNNFINYKTITSLVLAIFIYVLATILWIIVLRKIDLGKIYPIMALAFVMTPIGCHFLFGENFSNNYIIGASILLIGLLIIVTE